MKLAPLIRSLHRWTSILFTAIVALLFALSAMGPVSQTVYLAPLPPLAVMTLTGLYLFAQPYLARRRRS